MCFFFSSVGESLLSEELLKREDLEDAAAKNDEGFDDREENDTVIDLNVGLSEFVFRAAVHLLVIDELVGACFHSFDFLLQTCNVNLLSGILLLLLLL